MVVEAQALCQYIEYWKKWDSKTQQVVDPPIPIRCLQPEVVPYLHPWTPHVGQISHAFQRFSEIHRWTI